MSGPDDKWFGIGFGSSIMTDAYSIICFKNTSSHCQENKLGAIGPDGYGQKLNPSINVISDNSSPSGIRSVYISRNISIDNPNYFSFPTWSQQIDIIYAIGNAEAFDSQTTSMGPGGAAKLLIANALTNNVTVNATKCGSDIVLNSIVVYPDQNMMQLNMSGPANVYFGIGFNSSMMKGAYVIMCDANGCYENYFDGHSYGTLLNNTLNVVSVTSSNGMKTVLVNRKANLTNGDIQYFTFPDATSTVPIIYAIGQANVWSSSNAMSFDASTYGSVNIQFVGTNSGEYTLIAKQPLFTEVDQTIDIKIYPTKFCFPFCSFHSQM